MSLISDETLRSYGYTIQWYLTDAAKYLALWGISEASKEYGFTYVLGGGTGLNDIYFPSHVRRFSRDLDLYLVDIAPEEFCKYINTVLERSRYYQEINVLGANLVTQGFIYEGITRNNAIYRFRLMLPSSISLGLKIANIIPANVKKRGEFNKWYMENKNRLPRVYEIEVAIFRGERKYANPIQEKIYDLPARGITGWINLPDPYRVKVFSLEDLLANKIEGIISGMVARGIVTGGITGRRAIKARDIYDVVIAFSEELYIKEKLARSLDILNIDMIYAVKAIRLAMLQAAIDPNKYREIVGLAPSMRGRLRDWVSMVLKAYEKTLSLHDHTPEDYIAYKLVLNEEIKRNEIERRFNISRAQISHIFSKLEKLGFLTTRSEKTHKDRSSESRVF
jgi:predicted nucleotidyltransferase component of viral defense system